MTVKDYIRCMTSKDGKTYYYDNREEKWVQLVEKYISFSELPEDISKLLTENWVNK
jgi:hypothetical protein